jgi:septum formation topological specificity factor MinE
MEKIKLDIYAVLQKYMDIGSEVEDFDIRVESTRVEGSDVDVPALVANIPIVGMKKIEGR